MVLCLLADNGRLTLKGRGATIQCDPIKFGLF